MTKQIKELLIKLSAFLTTLPDACWVDRSIFEYMKGFEGKRVLNLGAGVGLFDGMIPVQTINLDIQPNPRIHIVADAHSLPFKDNSIDCVFSNAVLEHVRFPWLVSKEIHRVLKPGGLVIISVPFLNIIHDSHDYYRFTGKGLRACFNDFKLLKEGVNAGPMAFFVVYAGFFITTVLEGIFGRKAGFLLSLPFKAMLYPLYYLDLLLKGERWQTFADAFYFIGLKEEKHN